ncbi:MAG: hypothetical protein CMJ78_23820 [Planctomycetaceae bacterium]|nr:hypothetical protein [Planctomycetaceae bacterium]
MAITEMIRRWWPAFLGVVYLSFPIVTLVRFGFEDFLAALLWPIPCILGLVLLGTIPFWAGHFGNETFVIVWIIEGLVCALVTVYMGRRHGNYSKVLCRVWGVFAVLNIIGLFLFPVEFPN